MILLIDNYDSFSYNLVQFFGTFIRTTSSSLPDPDIRKTPVFVRMWSAR